MRQYYIHLSACYFAIVYLYKEIKFKTKPNAIELECNFFSNILILSGAPNARF